MMHKIPTGGENNARELLRSMGMGDFNATIAIQYMFIAPAATDPSMPSIILMTKHLQHGLRAAGAEVPVSGRIDQPTAAALEELVGPDWASLTWYMLLSAVLGSRQRAQALDLGPSTGLSGILDLPDVPGGTFTWLLGAAAAYYFLIHKKKRS